MVQRAPFGGALAACLLCHALAMHATALPLPLDGVNGWSDPNGFKLVVDPQDANNTILDASGNGGNAAAHTGIEPLSAAGTLFFELCLRDTSSADLSMGPSASSGSEIDTTSAADSAMLIGPCLRIVDARLQVHDGDWYDLATLEVGSTYKFWQTIDNAADTWQAYIQGGAYTSQTQLSHSDSDTNFAFRGSTGSQALVSLVIRGNNSNAASGGALLDNFFVDPDGYALDDPTSIRPRIAGMAIQSQSLRLDWTPVPGAGGYRVESTTNLLEPFAEETSGTLSNETWTVAAPPPRVFYRVVATNTP